MTLNGLNRTRSTEWLLSICMFLWGVKIMQPLTEFDAPVYGVMKLLIRETGWGAIAVTIGALRMLGLAINGLWRRSPVIRAFGSFCAGLFWLAVCVLMWMGNQRYGGYLPVGVTAFYPVFFLFEGWCLAAAGYDMQKNNSLSYRSA